MQLNRFHFYFLVFLALLQLCFSSVLPILLLPKVPMKMEKMSKDIISQMDSSLASTSSYQLEGGYLNDGKGLNNWDAYFHSYSRKQRK
ncbi:hypothetical protein ACOSQ2_031044 [Xanthoceras sorbifolium]